MFGRRGRATALSGFAGSGATVATIPRSPASQSEAEGLRERFAHWLKLSLTGASGILAAVIVDLQNRGDNSALFVVARSLVYAAAMVGIVQVPLYVTICTLMALGAAVVLYFRPSGLRPAFMTGFGSLAALMTLVPGYSGETVGVPIEDQGSAVPVIERGDVDQVVQVAPNMRLAGFVPAAVEEDAPAEPNAEPGKAYDLAVRMAFPRGVPEPIALSMTEGRLKARLYNPVTRKAYNLFLAGGGPVIREGDTLLARAVIPAGGEQGPLLLRIEADGYRIEVAETTATAGENPVWDVVLDPTTEPLIFQRLKHSYAF